MKTEVVHPKPYKGLKRQILEPIFWDPPTDPLGFSWLQAENPGFWRVDRAQCGQETPQCKGTAVVGARSSAAAES